MKLPLAVGILAFAHPLLWGDIISEYSQAAVTASAGIADFGAPQSQTPERNSESVKRRNRILGGVPCERSASDRGKPAIHLLRISVLRSVVKWEHRGERGSWHGFHIEFRVE